MTSPNLSQTLFQFAEQYLQRPLAADESDRLQQFRQTLNTPDSFAGLLQTLGGILEKTLHSPSTAGVKGTTAQTGGADSLSPLLTLFDAFRNKTGDSGNSLGQMLLHVAEQYLRHEPAAAGTGASSPGFGLPGNLMDTIRNLGGLFSHTAETDGQTAPAATANMSEAHKTSLIDNLNRLLTILDTFRSK